MFSSVKGIHMLNISTFCQVFISYVRPILEYNSPVWNPWLLQYVSAFSPELYFKQVKLPTMSYADRLLHLGFHSLVYHRVFLDLLMCFKIVKYLVDLDASVLNLPR